MALQNKYQSIFETTLDGIIVINANGVVEDMNSAALFLFGYQKDEVLGQNVNFLMPEPHRSKHGSYIHNYKTTRKPKIIGIGREVEGRKKNGELFPFRLAVSEFETDGEQFFTGIIHDLTQRKIHEKVIRGYAEELEERVELRTSELREEIELREMAQKALVESQLLYETIAKNFPNGAILVIDEKFNTVFAEGSELRARGPKAVDRVGKNFLENIPQEWRKMLEDTMKVVFGNEVRIVEYQDEEKSYRINCVPLTINQGEVKQVLMVKNNITQEKRAESEISEALAKAKHLNELKTSFVSMASHEFRTPLSSILSSAALVGKYTETNQQENRLGHLQKIRNNVQNLTMILNDFLSLERIEAGVMKCSPETVEIDDLLAGAAEDAGQMLKVGQTVAIENQANNAQWKVDVFLLRNVLLNLISNAIKYSDDQIILRATTDKNCLTILVIDRGIGISNEDQKKLFGRFYRASNAGNIQGTGLGLNIVKRYAKIMGAQISFESKLNEGSTFRITLYEYE